MLTAVVLAALGGWLLPVGAGPAAARLRSPGQAAGSAGSDFSGDRLPAWPARMAAGLAAVLMLTGRVGGAVVLLVAAVLLWWPRRAAESARRRRSAGLARDVPRAADLLATCLDAGLSLADAAVVVGQAVGGETGAALVRAGARLRAGADLGDVWPTSRPGSEGDGWQRLGRAIARASVTGAPLSDLLAAVAQDERERSRWTAEAAAQRAGVLAVGPLAACFLPAFVLVGIVPVVAGIAARVAGEL